MSKVTKVHKIEGEAAKKIGALYDASHKAGQASQEADRAFKNSKRAVWEAIQETIGVKSGNMKLNTDYRKNDLLLVEEIVNAEGEKCPGCGQVHEGGDGPHIIEINLGGAPGTDGIPDLASLLRRSDAGKPGSQVTALLDKLIDDHAPADVKEAWADIKRLRKAA